MTVKKNLADRIREWDEQIEDQNAPDEEARKPFDAGVMLAAADVIANWESGDLAGAINGLRESLEAVIE